MSTFKLVNLTQLMYIFKSYCQIVSAKNAIKRKLYSLFSILKQDKFDDCIFIDECKIELEIYSTRR